MTTIRAKGFDSRAELDKHLVELEDDAPADTRSDMQDEGDLSAMAREIAWLRKDVADLGAQVTLIRRRDDHRGASTTEEQSWLRIAATIGATFVLGKLVRRLHLGAVGAAAVPFIAARINRRFL